MREFEDLRQGTQCPFAPKAKVWVAPQWQGANTFEENSARHARSLSDFARVALKERYHGFAAKIGLIEFREFHGVKHTFHRYLLSLATYDKSCAACMARDFLSDDWQFEFSNVRMFLNVFGACYAPPHSKYLDVKDAFLVFFQPEFSFDLCGTNPLNEKLKSEIRDRFAAAGMPYNGRQIDERIESLLYMFPQDPKGNPVRWWE